MRDNVVPLHPHSLPDDDTYQAFLDFFLEERCETTARAYLKDLGYLQQYLMLPSVLDVVRFLLDTPPLLVNRRIQEWKHAMENGGDHARNRFPLAPRSVNRRLSTVRSLLRCAVKMGLSSTPSISVRDLPDLRVKDVHSPDPEAIAKVLEVLSHGASPKASRDFAIAALASVMALRRQEICSLDVEDVDLSSSRIRISSKGGTLVSLSLPPLVRKALALWLGRRDALGITSPALFINLASNSKQERLSTTSVYRLIRSAGDLAGSPTPVRPHGLRRCAINQVVARYGLVKAAEFARHRDVRSTMEYLDPDEAGQLEIRNFLASGLGAAVKNGKASPDAGSVDDAGESQ
jgi:integrase